MEWRLTSFERKRILAIALDHPYFDGRKPLLTKKEMAAILEQRRQRTGEQVLREVMAELGKSYDPTPRRRTLREALGDAFYAPAFRRTAVLLALALLLTFFMTVTVPGRALAEELQRVVVTFADGALHFSNTVPAPAQEQLDFSLVPPTAEEAEAFAELTRLPILLSRDEDVRFRYELWEESLFISTVYRTPDGKRYRVDQDFYAPGTYWGVGFNAQDYTEIPSPIRYDAEITLYAGVAADGTPFIQGFADAFHLTIMSSDMTLSELESCLPRLYVWCGEGEDAPSTAEELDFSRVPQTLETPQALAELTRFPVLLSDDELTQFRYYSMTNKLMMRSWYRTEDGHTYQLHQSFYGANVYWGAVTDMTSYTRIPSRFRYDGEIVLYAGTSPDGWVKLIGYADVFLVTLTSNDMTLSELKTVMKHIRAWTPEG